MTKPPANYYDIQSVESVLHALIAALELQASITPSENDSPDKRNTSDSLLNTAGIDKIVRSAMGLLKFLEALTELNTQHLAANSEKAEIRYEDLPPLNAEDLLALRRRFTHLANETSIRAGMGEFYPEVEFK